MVRYQVMLMLGERLLMVVHSLTLTDHAAKLLFPSQSRVRVC